MRAAVIGGGSWGTALASVLAGNGWDVVVWSHDPEVAVALGERHENPKYLPGLPLPPSVRGSTDLAEALSGAELVVAASPSHVTREVMERAAPALPRATPIVCASKGIENETLLTMNEVLEEVLPPEMHPYLAFLSGPSFAKETMKRMPTAVVVAATWERIARQVQRVFSNDYFRVYTSNDVAGVELGGSLKNVCAIAAGIADGMGFGHNTRAAIITRGLAELVRLAVKKGEPDHALRARRHGRPGAHLHRRPLQQPHRGPGPGPRPDAAGSARRDDAGRGGRAHGEERPRPRGQAAGGNPPPPRGLRHPPRRTTGP